MDGVKRKHAGQGCNACRRQDNEGSNVVTHNNSITTRHCHVGNMDQLGMSDICMTHKMSNKPEKAASSRSVPWPVPK